MRERALAAVLLCTFLVAAAFVAAAVAVAQAKPEFQLGFEALAEQIPEEVGEPLEDAHPAEGGKILQTTTRGLMVWREADNWTGFTDGSRTWVAGPSGVVDRPNDERLPFESRPPLTFDDPAAYCAAAGTIDRPDDRYTGPRYPEVVKQAFARILSPGAVDLPERGIFLRCLDGRLLACTVGANLNCGLADTRTEPTPGMVDYCRGNPESDFIPLAVVGHSGIFDWRCRAGSPEIARQSLHVDPRGFVAEFWHEIPPLPGDNG